MTSVVIVAGKDLIQRSPEIDMWEWKWTNPPNPKHDALRASTFINPGCRIMIDSKNAKCQTFVRETSLQSSLKKGALSFCNHVDPSLHWQHWFVDRRASTKRNPRVGSSAGEWVSHACYGWIGWMNGCENRTLHGWVWQVMSKEIPTSSWMAYTKSPKDRRHWGTYFFYLIWAREISPRSGQIEDPPWPGCCTSDIRIDLSKEILLLYFRYTNVWA